MRLTMPALIVNSQYAALLTEGYALAGGKVLHKRAECRGARCHTSYRGAVAIFCSNSYYAVNEDPIAWWILAAQNKKRLDPRTDTEIRAWCRMSHSWRYRLRGFVRLTDSIRTEPLCEASERGSQKAEKEIRRLAMLSTDHNAEWSVECYLLTDPLHATPTPTLAPRESPLFTECCAGCLARPPHNMAACHCGWQTVSLDAAIVPKHVQKEVQPWPSKQARKR